MACYGTSAVCLPGGCLGMFNSSVINRARRIKEAFDKKRLSLALAESCTGGLIGGAVTEIPGSSSFFLGSAGTYSDRSKISVLSVPKSVLDSYGAVSSQCAMAMAEGALSLYGSDVALSVTGVAGPDGGSEEKPVGLVWFGLAVRGKDTRAFSRVFPGGRSEIREATVLEALRSILQEAS